MTTLARFGRQGRFRSRGSGRAARAVTVVAVLALGAALPSAGLAHGPDPVAGSGIWYPNQAVPYTWASGQVPPTWLQGAVNGAANDANATRASRAAVFNLQAGAASRVAYGEPTGCSTSGIACFSRSAPTSFRVWFRADGYRFDWGTLRWCQGPSGSVDGCFDAENIGLDELGHVLGLGHHVNYANDSDYADAVVQATSRARPRTGWNVHALGRCDVARLQLLYDRQTTAAPFSSCLSLSSVTSIVPSSWSAWSGGSIAFTATVRTAVSSSYGALSGDGVSNRTVVLERRFPGAATWTTVGTMTPQAAAGTYAMTATVTGSYEWRARFPKPTGEGILGSTSAAVFVSLQSCGICPNAMGAATGPGR